MRALKTAQPGRDAGRWLAPVLIVLVTVLVFFPSLQNGFVNWDDDKNLLDNPNYRGLGLAQLGWMFSTLHMSLYRPLTWITFGMDYLLWGTEPFGYHLTSLLLHGANAVLFYFVTLRLLAPAAGPAAPGELALRASAGFAALLFAIHPLRVEAVAWASARNDVLSGLFFLSTILGYLRATKAESLFERRRWMVAAVTLYGASLLSKPIGLTLPFILLSLDVYPLRRLGRGPNGWFGAAARRIWLEKAPFLFLAAAAGVVGVVAKQEAGVMEPLERYGFIPRLSQALFGLVFYLWKTALPLGLSPLYELGTDAKLWGRPFLLSGWLVLAVTLVLIKVRQRWAAGLSSWVYYAVALAPVLGIAQSGPQLVADRYSYLSCLSWAVLAGAGVFYCWEAWTQGRLSRRTFRLAAGAALIALFALGVLTWRQAQVWRDSERLWRDALTVAPRSSFAHNNLGSILSERGRLEEAEEHYRQALRIDPANAATHYNLGIALARRGGLEEAIAHFRRALEIDPAYAEAHYNLGTALTMQREFDEAIVHFRRAVEIQPDYAKAHYNLGAVLSGLGESREAIARFREALRVDPEFVQAHEALAEALFQQGKRDEAIEHQREAARLREAGQAGQAAR